MKLCSDPGSDGRMRWTMGGGGGKVGSSGGGNGGGAGGGGERRGGAGAAGVHGSSCGRRSVPVLQRGTAPPCDSGWEARAAGSIHRAEGRSRRERGRGQPPAAM